MKRRIVCFGDSNTWGFDAEKNGRFLEIERWPSLLREKLSNEFQVIEEGLSGRRSVVDDPLFEGLNAFNYIHPCLMSHSPMELIIIMLGTNDTKERFNLTSYNIAQGILRLALKAKSIPAGVQGTYPEVLVIAPPSIGAAYADTEIGKAMGRLCAEKSLAFPIYLVDLLKDEQIHFMATEGLVSMNNIDFMHLDREGHKILSGLVANKIIEIL